MALPVEIIIAVAMRADDDRTNGLRLLGNVGAGGIIALEQEVIGDRGREGAKEVESVAPCNRRIGSEKHLDLDGRGFGGEEEAEVERRQVHTGEVKEAVQQGFGEG